MYIFDRNTNYSSFENVPQRQAKKSALILRADAGRSIGARSKVSPGSPGLSPRDSFFGICQHLPNVHARVAYLPSGSVYGNES